MTFDRRAFIASGAALTATTLAGPLLAAEPLSVVATTGMIADAARVVGGDLVELRALMGPGVDPHAYRPTRSDIAAMAQADLVLWHGLYLEAQMEEFLIEIGTRVPSVAVGEAVPRDLRIGHDHYADRFDPHVWMDPSLWAAVVDAIGGALSEVDPGSAEVFGHRRAIYLDEIAALDRYARDVLATVPDRARLLVTAHDAFNYFGRAFGFEVQGIQGISTESEAGLKRIGDLVDLLVERQVGAVFVETSVSDRSIRALIEGAAARGHDVAIGGELFSDAMGEPGTYEGTYRGMIDHNVTTIAQALGGQAPERGMNGQLSF